MKKSLLLVVATALALLAIALTRTPKIPVEIPTGHDFYLSIAFEEQEHSMDAHWEVETLTIADNQGTYTWHYGGYHPDEDFDTEKSLSFTLDDAELEQIKQTILTQKLNRSINERRPIENDSTSVDLQTVMLINDTTTVSKIVGMKSVWNPRTEDVQSNIKHIDYVRKIQRLISDGIDAHDL